MVSSKIIESGSIQMISVLYLLCVYFFAHGVATENGRSLHYAIHQKIRLGISSKPHEFPFIVMIKDESGRSCSGVILDANFILTVAHCIHSHSKFYVVYAGKHKEKIVEEVFSHPNYNEKMENDIAIFKLKTPLDLTSASVQPVKMPHYNDNFIGDATIAGWGLEGRSLHPEKQDSEGRTIWDLPTHLLKAKVPLRNGINCKSAYQGKKYSFNPTTMICAGDDTFDACRGDSGSPLICQTLAGEKNVLCGLVSYGRDCYTKEENRLPGVYTKVSFYLYWIYGVLRAHYSNNSNHGLNHCTNLIDATGCNACQESFEFYCHFSKQCLPKEKLCDGYNDCGDGLDEMGCSTCQPWEYVCPKEIISNNNNSKCIDGSLVCNGDNDCGNGFDESGCLHLDDPLKSCGQGKFQCQNGQCRDLAVVCDFDRDCSDGSDELGCKNCHSKDFLCRNITFCMSQDLFCDGNNDCGDWSDELNCGGCAIHQFRCGIGKGKIDSEICIEANKLCDRMLDCPDGSDEYDCEYNACKMSGQLSCDNGSRCIDENMVCDSKTDCYDGFDENGCNLFLVLVSWPDVWED